MVTIANSPPTTPTIVFPSNNQFFNSKPIALNITFAADADNDAITINYYIDNKPNGTSSFNVTFNGSDGTYRLNVTLFDGTVYSANASYINFTLDTVAPVVNATLNESKTNIGLGDVINLTANATDERSGLSFGQIIVNDTGFNRIFNFSLSAAGASQFSQNITVACNGGCVINFTARANDTANNFKTNDTIRSPVHAEIPEGTLSFTSIQNSAVKASSGESNVSFGRNWANALYSPASGKIT